MSVLIDVVGEGDRLEFAVHGRHARLACAVHQDFIRHSITDQVGDRNYLQTMSQGELLQVWQASHRAVVIHDFADHAARNQSGNSREVDYCFRLTRPHEDTAVARSERKDVTGPREGWRPGSRVDRKLNRSMPNAGAESG